MGRSAGLEPRSVDESKSATANSCVATKPKSTAKETKASHFPWGVWVSQLGLVKTFCST
ncbi:hypothetical protein [Leptospira noguchii]|uniref:hypothetical protein n=1 Tax=Leptospira noguchii TaxID=28182 RepID=UPI001FB830B3|nr:hypothetical protein [Leptospira noguchii]UOG54903.1 hypothetical protein MAL09_20030 [Leptospira noguchii]